MHSITIPIGNGTFTAEQFKKYCKHFNCSAIKESRNSDYWIISSDDPANFFWLGVNMNFSVQSSLVQTFTQSITGKKA